MVDSRGERRVVLRAEVKGADRRNLWAWSDSAGDLHIDGQDLGPGTAVVSSDGEYEWFRTVRAAHVPALVAALGGAPGTDVLDLLATNYADDVTAQGSYALETTVRTCGVPSELFVWSG